MRHGLDNIETTRVIDMVLWQSLRDCAKTSSYVCIQCLIQGEHPYMGVATCERYIDGTANLWSLATLTGLLRSVLGGIFQKTLHLSVPMRACSTLRTSNRRSPERSVHGIALHARLCHVLLEKVVR